MSKPNPIPNSKPFPKGKSGNPKGRPKKGVAATLSALKEQGVEEVTAEQVRGVMLRLMNLPRGELVKLGSNTTDTPILDALVARALAGKDGWAALNDILDRMHGKPKQAMDLSGTLTSAAPSVTVQVLPPSHGATGG